MKKLISGVMSVVALTSVLAFPASGLAQEQVQQSAPIIQFGIPDPGPSFTLMGERTEIFDNTMTYGTLYGMIGSGIAYLVVPTSLGWALAGGAGTGALTTYVNNLLGIKQILYTKIRVGLSWNSYLGYYEYVESIVRYTNNSLITVDDVYYVQTGTRVPDDVVRLYGLNPYPYG